MASTFFLMKQFEDVLLYLSSVKTYFPNDDAFNFNYAQVGDRPFYSIASQTTDKGAISDPSVIENVSAIVKEEREFCIIAWTGSFNYKCH